MDIYNDMQLKNAVELRMNLQIAISASLACNQMLSPPGSLKPALSLFHPSFITSQTVLPVLQYMISGA